jgi:hypothetical protein
MARIRSIKPEFWTSEQVTECSIAARLLFIGIWNFCDDAGRIGASPKQIKALVLPSDDMTVENVRGLIHELERNGLVLRYAVDDKEYLQVTGWSHQRIDKPQPAKFPPPPATLQDRSKSIPGTFQDGEDRRGIEHSQVISLPTVERKPSTAPQAAQTDFRGDLFERGRTAVEAMTGMPAPKARTLIGSWLKLANDEAVIVLEAIDAASEARPADPVPWIRRTIESRMRTRDPPKRVWGSV